jgi:hypothetical protein
MKYLYTWAKMPKDQKAITALQDASFRLEQKLAGLDLGSLGISEYNQRYLGSKVKSLESALQLYGYLLLLALANRDVPIGDFVFVDYGGGSGLMSLLAKEMGIGTVIYNDIYDVSCDDVALTAEALGLKLDHIVCGEIDDLIRYLNDHSIAIHAITSFDVIEHIYDIDAFMQKMALLPHASLRVVHGSGANIKNPQYVYQTAKKHREVETKDRPKVWGAKERDTLRSYYAVRLEIIQTYAPDLSSSEAVTLANLTRGLRIDDITRSVDEYKEKGVVRYRPDHPTNTCDPYTGNWAEHLMDTDRFEPVLKKAGFSVQILSGYWGNFKRRFLNLAVGPLNGIISVLGANALAISPYYIVYARMD